MSEYDPNQESHINELMFTVPEQELQNALRVSEQILAISIEDAINWTDNGEEYTLLRFTQPELHNNALLASRTRTNEQGTARIDRYMVETETGNMLAYDDDPNVLPPTPQQTTQEDWVKFNDILVSGLEFIETFNGLRAALGDSVFRLLGMSEPDDIDADIRDLLGE